MTDNIQNLMGNTEVSGQNLKVMRTHLGYIGTEFSKILGVAPETLSRWENNKSKVPRHTYILVQKLVKEKIQGKTGTLDDLKRHSEGGNPTKEG